MKRLTAIVLLASVVPAYSQPDWRYFSQECWTASELIKRNQCAGVKGGCDCALKKTLELGCHIQYWNHIPRCPKE